MNPLQSQSDESSTSITGKKAKRRSLLPQFSRKGSNEEHPSMFGGSRREGPAEQDDRPVQRPFSQDTRAAGVETMEKPSLVSRLGRPRPVSMMPAMDELRFKQVDSSLHLGGMSQDLNPGQTSKGKSASGEAAHTVNTHRHVRTQTLDSGLKRTESVKSTSIRTPSIPSRTTSARPSQSLSRAANSKTSTDGGRERSSSNRLASTKILNSHVGSGSGSMAASILPVGNSSSSVGARSRTTSGGGTNSPSPPRSQLASGGRLNPAGSANIPRPAFNVYQQHYSPAKSALPKPPVPTTRGSSVKTPSGTNNSHGEEHAPSDGDLDTAKQQIELLQLLLLHDASLKAADSHNITAKRKLGQKHARLGREYENVRIGELQHQRTDNLEALGSWCRNHDMVVENLQILSMVHSDLTTLLENGGRHHDLISAFEEWMDTADSNSNAEPVFMQPLTSEWKTMHASLGLKLRGMQRNLSVLPPPPMTASPGAAGSQSSALAIVLTSCRELVENLQQELDTMLKVEKEVLARECVRVDDEAKEVAMDYRLENNSARGYWTPAWLGAVAA